MKKLIAVILILTMFSSFVSCSTLDLIRSKIKESVLNDKEDTTVEQENLEEEEYSEEENSEEEEYSEENGDVEGEEDSEEEEDSEDEDEDEGSEEEDSAPGEPKVGPVGEWDEPIPEINPLGSQKNYDQISYSIGDHTLKYIENFLEIKKTLSGDVWYFQMGKESGVSMEFLEKYALSLGATVYSTGYDDKLMFKYIPQKDSVWWADVLQKSEEYEMTVVKEKMLVPGQEVTFKPCEMEEPPENITFVSNSDGKKFQSAVIKIPEGSLILEIRSELIAGGLENGSSYYKELYSKKTTTYVLDDIPQGEGTYKWTFTWDEPPEEFSVLLDEIGELPKVKLGDEPGALKVSGADFGSVKVEPQKYGYTYHRDLSYLNEYSIDGNITPEGDTLFWLPAGLWNVIISEGAGLEYSKIRLVPVNSGETTHLSFPESLKSAYGNLNQYFADENDLTGGITFVESADLGENASISIMVNDPLNRDIYPDTNNTIITESGTQVKILDITRKIAPPSVVLVLDSSGSMGNHMPATIAAAKKFISGLPDKTYIRVIDFDTEVKLLEGSDKATVIKNLSSVGAGGYTKLFDATLEGLKLLEEKTRPALVIFADGADSSLFDDEVEMGSSAALEDVLYTIEESQIPIYTIGFGDDPDESAMRAFATTSKGQYYSAKDETALGKVFDAIGSKFGNSFVITYQRPEESNLSDTPVVSIILDASASMDIDPEEEEGCGYRIDNMKTLFHDFILQLPKDCLYQLTSFQTGPMGGDIIRQEQVTTDSRVRLLQGLGEMESFGGTPILESIKIGYESLKAVPSKRKVIVYLTDAALEVDEYAQPEFERLLNSIKEENITILWIGMGVEDKEEVFARAAELSNGQYVVSEDVAQFNKALSEVLATIQEEKLSKETPLSISIRDQNDKGDVLSFAANTSVAFPKVKSSGKAVEPDTMKITTGLPMDRYDKETASIVTGTGVPGEETVMTQKMTVDVTGSNDSASVQIKDIYFFSKMKGLEPPNEKLFMVVSLEIKNITQNKIPYMIPSIHNHFYITINNEGSYPVSDATWITEKPLSPPGEPEVLIPSGETITGTLVFLVTGEPLTQASFHFYDLTSGHIQLPIIGKIGEQLLDVKNLTTETPVKITDAFSMSVTGYSDLDQVDRYIASEDTSFRVVESKFDSKVQALLDINPAQRFYHRINTTEGPLFTKLSDVTAVIPFGFMSPVMLAPGSSNRTRLVYQISNGFKEAPAEIWGDVSSGELKVPVVKGNVTGKQEGAVYNGDGIKVTVNRLAHLDGTYENFNEYWMVADVTFTDVADGFGTVIPEDCFHLVRKDYEETWLTTGSAGLGDFSSGGLKSEGILEVEFITNEMLYGIDSEWPVFDGASRRGIVLFLIPEEGHEWLLKSPYFPDLSESPTNETYANKELIKLKTDIPIIDDDFEAQLDRLVQEAIVKYATIAKSGSKQAQTLRLGGDNTKNNIPAPTVTFSGGMKLQKANTISDFVTTMQSLKWIPASMNSKTFQYAPEAVLTQGWGTEWDLFNLGKILLSKTGATPTKRLLTLTEKGKKELAKQLGSERIETTNVPGILYKDDKGKQKIFVIPFMKFIDELEGLVLFSSTQEDYEYYPDGATITVYAKVEPSQKTVADQMGDIGNILGGGDGETNNVDYISLLEHEISLPVLSLDAIDVGYLKVGTNQFTAFIKSASGTTVGSYLVDGNTDKILGIRIEILMRDNTLVHEKDFAQEDTIDQYHHVIALNLPDLPEDALNDLNNRTKVMHDEAENPDSLSALSWYGRNILHRFIGAQTQFDLDISKDLDLILGRITKERCIILTSYMDLKANKLRTTMDLLQANNQCHSKDEKIVAAYNIGAGMFISGLEGGVLIGDEKISFLDLWNRAPQGANIMFIPTDGYEDSEIREKIANEMKEQGIYPNRLIQAIAENEKVIFTPDKPILIDGQERWAWLEIDPKTYETISVFDTGEHAGMASYLLTVAKENAGDMGMYMVGALMGVEVSIWAVASFSLKYDDYRTILKEAMAVTGAIGEHLDGVMKGYGMALDQTLSYGVGGNLPINLNFSISLDEGYKQAMKQNIVGFSQGYNDGASLYFTMAFKDLKPEDDGKGKGEGGGGSNSGGSGG